MKRELNSEVSKPVIFALVAAALILVCWIGWHATSSGQDDGKANVDAAAQRMAAQGIDIKTVPKWSDMWYKYHPEYKGPHPPVTMPAVNVPVPGSNGNGASGSAITQ